MWGQWGQKLLKYFRYFFSSLYLSCSDWSCHIWWSRLFILNREATFLRSSSCSCQIWWRSLFILINCKCRFTTIHGSIITYTQWSLSKTWFQALNLFLEFIREQVTTYKRANQFIWKLWIWQFNSTELHPNECPLLAALS